MSEAGHLDWLLDDLVARVPHINQAVILSGDGLLAGASRGLSRPDADYLAAVAAGFQSLARSAGQAFGSGDVRQTVIELEQAFLFITAAGQASCLAVLASADSDPGLVAYEMTVLVKRMGDYLGIQPRTAASPAEARW